jgi:hypothetical protein
MKTEDRTQRPGVRGQRSQVSGQRSAFGLAVLLLALAVFAADAQDYAVDWWTVDGGGGTSTGGVYALSGTIGQPDTGEMSGGTFTLVGGFLGGGGSHSNAWGTFPVGRADQRRRHSVLAAACRRLGAG